MLGSTSEDHQRLRLKLLMHSGVFDVWLALVIAMAGLQCSSEGVGFPDTSYVCVMPPGCGDGVIGDGEECDDGNEIDWDGCTCCVVSEFRVESTSEWLVERLAVAMSDDGGFLVVWESWHKDGDLTCVVGRWFNSAGEPRGPEVHRQQHHRVQTERTSSRLRFER